MSAWIETVSTEKIQNGAVINSKIGNRAVTTGKIQYEAVTNDELADNSVSTEKIQSAAITTAKLNDGAVYTSKIRNEAVTVEKLADEVLEMFELGEGSVGSGTIANGSVTKPKLSTDLQTLIDKYMSYEVKTQSNSVNSNFTIGGCIFFRVGRICFFSCEIMITNNSAFVDSTLYVTMPSPWLLNPNFPAFVNYVYSDGSSALDIRLSNGVTNNAVTAIVSSNRSANVSKTMNLIFPLTFIDSI